MKVFFGNQLCEATILPALPGSVGFDQKENRFVFPTHIALIEPTQEEITSEDFEGQLAWAVPFRLETYYYTLMSLSCGTVEIGVDSVFLLERAIAREMAEGFDFAVAKRQVLKQLSDHNVELTGKACIEQYQITEERIRQQWRNILESNTDATPKA